MSLTKYYELKDLISYTFIDQLINNVRTCMNRYDADSNYLVEDMMVDLNQIVNDYNRFTIRFSNMDSFVKDLDDKAKN